MKIKPWISWRGKDIVCGALSRLLWPRSSAATLVFRDGKLLAIDTGSYLMLPGGALEYGEYFEEAAERETLEETGYRVEAVKVVDERINSVGGEEKVLEAELVKEEPVSDGNWEGEPIWIDVDEAEGRRWRHNRDVGALIEKRRKQS